MSFPSLQRSQYALDVQQNDLASINVSQTKPKPLLSQDDRITSPGNSKSIGHGASGVVLPIDEARVMKVFSNDEEGQMDLKREKDIFEKLQNSCRSEYVIEFYEQWGSALVLERLATTLRNKLKELPQGSQHPSALQWSLESCRGMAFLHENDIIHGDVGCQNILISGNGHVKICDFAGSKMGEEDAWVAYEARSQHPLFWAKQPNITTEIFAIGSTLFEIWTSRPPYETETDRALQKKFLNNDFPLNLVKDNKIRRIIGRCWKGGYENVSDICGDLESMEASHGIALVNA